MRVFVCAQQEFGRDVVKALYDAGHEITGVAPPPQGRLKDKVTGFATLRGIPIVSDCDRLTAADIPDGTDLIVTAFSYWMVSQKALDKTTYGGIGFHPSLLPRHRGREAVRWAWTMGDPVTGGTVYWLDQKCDGGDILSQQVVFIEKGCRDYHDIWADIYPIGIQMIADAVASIESGEAGRTPQDERFATWEPSFERPRLKRNDLIMLGGASVEKGGSCLCGECEKRGVCGRRDQTIRADSGVNGCCFD